MGEPKHHHYVPAAYLAGFTTSGKRDGALYCHDRRSGGSPHRTSPIKTAKKRNLYRLDEGAHEDPLAMEKGFAKIEAHGISAVRDCIASRTIPEGEQADRLFGFVALQVVRVPAVSDDFARGFDIGMRQAFRRDLEDSAWREEHLGGVSLEEALDGLNNLRFHVDQNTKIRNMTGPLLEEVCVRLDEREWTVARAIGGEFVTCDRPVSVWWDGEPETALPPHMAHRGLMLREPRTVVVYPLDPQTALVGKAEGRPAPFFVAQRGEPTRVFACASVGVLPPRVDRCLAGCGHRVPMDAGHGELPRVGCGRAGSASVAIRIESAHWWGCRDSNPDGIAPFGF